MNEITGTLLNILGFVLAFGFLVFIHEFGHYIVAKIAGIQVDEFGFGFPPRMMRLFNFRETEFTLNWIPFGAFVRPKGENDPSVVGGLAAADPWVRLAVLAAGSAMNLLAGVLLFSLVFTQVGRAPDLGKVLINDVNASSPAANAGIQKNDLIIKVNGRSIAGTTQLSRVVSQNRGKEITITLLRDGKTIETRAVPRVNPPENQGALGITMSSPMHDVNNWIQSLPFAAKYTAEQGKQLIALPGNLLRGQVSAEEGRLVGPKGIYDIYSAAREQDQQDASAAQQPEPPLGLNTLSFLATISIALGFTNLLPIPALDGGRILFVLPEILLRRRVPAQYENMVHLIGFAALIILMIYITTQDIINPIAIP